MCYFITAILPKEANFKEIQLIIENYKMAFLPMDNKSIIKQLKAGELYLRATRNYCDCDTVLGSKNKGIEKRRIMESKKVKKLKQKGWTTEQIEDWLENKIKTQKQTKGKKWWPELQEKEINNWLNFLKDLLEFKSISYVGLLKHWYEGNLESEDIKIIETKRLNLDQDLFDELLHMDEDIRYEFFRK